MSKRKNSDENDPMRIFDIASRQFKLDSNRLEASFESGKTIRATYDEVATDVARRAKVLPNSVIIVLDRAGHPMGVVDPEAVIQGCRQQKKIDVGTFEEAVRCLEEDPAEAKRGFHHEWLNDIQVDLKWCHKHSHLTVMPCRYQ